MPAVSRFNHGQSFINGIGRTQFMPSVNRCNNGQASIQSIGRTQFTTSVNRFNHGQASMNFFLKHWWYTTHVLAGWRYHFEKALISHWKSLVWHIGKAIGWRTEGRTSARSASALLVYGHCIVTLPTQLMKILKWLTQLPTLMQSHSGGDNATSRC